ncbi:MAG: nucleotidyltransferase family protein [Defluviitaleaceae bacterium]|nr:nucleotidyltransferase family protein [Defluviitaleaceae bacterium]
MKAIILVAGYATRMGQLTKNRPKALLPLGGRPVLDYIIDQLNTLPDVNEIIVVSNHKFYCYFEAWADVVETAIPVTVLNDGSTSESDRLGAIGDIHFAINKSGISEDIVVIAGDNFMEYPLLEQYQFFKEKQSDTVCAQKLTNRDTLKQFAVAELDENNKVISLEEKPQNPKSDVAIFATYFYGQDTLPLFSKYIEAGENKDAPGYFVQWLYKQKDVYAYIMNGECHDLGTVEAYEAMQTRLELESKRG